jgi:indole-3-glycerol phosphate synthase
MARDILKTILRHKSDEVASLERLKPLDEIKEEAVSAHRERRSLAHELSAPGVRIIAELKRGSPSKGAFRLDLPLEETAMGFEKGGAAAISILTDERFFFGHGDFLRRVRAVSSLPLLRKDFIVSPYQLYESVILGGDAVLLITRALDDGELRDLLSLCRDLGLEALVEVHDRVDLERATGAGAILIGINNRNLADFSVDLGIAEEIAPHLQRGQIAVAESGIHGRKDVERLMASGIRAFLVGEHLVRAGDPARTLRDLIGEPGDG